MATTLIRLNVFQTAVRDRRNNEDEMNFTFISKVNSIETIKVPTAGQLKRFCFWGIFFVIVRFRTNQRQTHATFGQ